MLATLWDEMTGSHRIPQGERYKGKDGRARTDRKIKDDSVKVLVVLVVC
jgi:hypothetical protein